MDRCVSVRLRHVFPQCCASRTAKGRKLHRHAVFYGKASPTSSDDYARLFFISYSREVFARSLERRSEVYCFEQRVDCVHCASGLCDRTPRTPHLSGSPTVSLGPLQRSKSLAAIAAGRGTLVA